MTERRATFTHFDYTGGANGLPVEAPDGDWEFESMTWLASHGPQSGRDKIGASTALHGMLLILWKRDGRHAEHDEAIRLALELAASKAPSLEHAQPYRAALAAMNRED